MKKTFITALLLVCAIFISGINKAQAQNLQLFYDAGRGCATSTVEMFRPDAGGSTFFFIDMFDTVGTLVGVCTKANRLDSIATTVGAILGTSTTTTYVESAAGVPQGGRSGNCLLQCTYLQFCLS